MKEIPLINVDELIDKALKDYYAGKKGVNKNLFTITDQTFDNAINQSVKLQYNVANQAFINELKTSATVFSTFKAHKESEAIAALLVDENGKKRTFSAFKNEALKVSEKYNKVHLKTEYNTALRRGKISAQFHQYKQDADLFPKLKWVPSTAAEQREGHQKYYGVVLPVEDEFWNNSFPGNLWNCQCGIEQTREGTTQVPSTLTDVPEGLEGNPAFTGKIMGDKHPYYQDVSKKDTVTINNFATKQTENSVNSWTAKNIPKTGLTIKNKVLQASQIVLTQTSVKNAVKAQESAYLKTYATVLKDDVANYIYLGYQEKNKTVFTFYKSQYGKQQVVIKMKVSSTGESLEGILDSIDLKELTTGSIPK